MQVYKVNYRLASIRVSISRGTIVISNMAFSIIKNNLIFRVGLSKWINEQNEEQMSSKVERNQIGESSRTLDFTFDANIALLIQMRIQFVSCSIQTTSIEP